MIHGITNSILRTGIIKKIRVSSPVQTYTLRRKYKSAYDRIEKLPADEKPSRFYACVYKNDKIAQISTMLEKTNITIRSDSRFQNWIDTGLLVKNYSALADNKAPDYSKVVNYSLHGLLDETNTGGSNSLTRNNRRLVNALEKYIKQIIQAIEDELTTSGENENLEKSRDHYLSMLGGPALSLEDALQRILFWSDLFWQSGHRLMGLGRLDKILDRFPITNEENALEIIKDFYDALHRYYPYKSNSVALGDTGQIIILGGLDEDGGYFQNEYTRLFIKALAAHKIPDPKLLLRVSSKMPRSLLEDALTCIATGVGSPLLSNDDVVIPSLEEFDYTHQDACNYITSACWEPQSYGNSLELNNIADLSYADALVSTYQDDRFEQCETFEDLVVLYEEKLDKEISETAAKLNRQEWEPDPLISFLTDGCARNGKDISEGGSIYNNYGILTVGMGNTINSLFAIRELAFGSGRKISLSTLKDTATNNYQNEEIEHAVVTNADWYGHDDPDVIALVKRLEKRVHLQLDAYRNKFGGKVKWGLSSSSYLETGRKVSATLDGRRSGEPLTTHISATGAVAYTELVSFASSLDYSGHASNGNVVDYFVSPTFIASNFEKYVDFLLASMKSGFFQMQMNVVDSETLISAKQHPELFPNLIVRVWGFSALFIELPPEYQDILIKRALASEGKNLAS